MAIAVNEPVSSANLVTLLKVYKPPDLSKKLRAIIKLGFCEAGHVRDTRSDIIRLAHSNPIVNELRDYLLAAAKASGLRRSFEEQNFHSQSIRKPGGTFNPRTIFGAQRRTKLIVLTGLRQKVSRAGLTRVMGISKPEVRCYLNPASGVLSLFERIGEEPDGTVSYRIRKDLPGRPEFLRLIKRLADLHPLWHRRGRDLDEESLSEGSELHYKPKSATRYSNPYETPKHHPRPVGRKYRRTKKKPAPSTMRRKRKS